MDYVSIYLKNDTPIMIPSRLEADLLNFGTTGLNDRWATYHANRLKDIDYDYGIVINFRDIKVSPEQVKEKEFRTEREIKAVARSQWQRRKGQPWQPDHGPEHEKSGRDGL